ncbi:GDYXXLXY domain-containing protein [Algiphilus sp.]|mgnify:CR=1 FL=1|uniref:GDYXXLXY domain-containing protein n=2 Tax=Algiphilus sp. TaxID=1872431 RepID=UPI002A65DA02|nr:GDYXXLXY domain-containing protein [Pseudomonadota bacterium]
MKRYGCLLAMLAVFALQWALPVSQIQQYQQVVDRGTAYRFRTAPVDPVDPFRGRYVTLQFAAAEMTVPAGASYPSDQPLYAPIRVEQSGFAVLQPPRRVPPEGDYLTVRVAHRIDDTRLRVRLPFDRYYLNERLAPEAERLAREAMRADRATSLAPSWAVVRVRNGEAVLTDLFIDGVPVRQRIAEAERALESEQ